MVPVYTVCVTGEDQAENFERLLDAVAVALDLYEERIRRVTISVYQAGNVIAEFRGKF